MRIISVGNFTGVGWDGSITDENHIAHALEGLGHDVFRFQRENTREPYWHLPKADFVLIQQYDGYAEDLITRLRMYTDRVVTWSFDHQAWGQEWHERLVAESDLYLSKRIADSKYPNWQYLSQNFAPMFLERQDYLSPAYQDIEVLFTGSYLPWATARNDTLKAVNKEFKLTIHSVNAWPEEFKDVRPPIMDDGLPALYNRAQVILSIDHTIEAGYHSDRNAQIMCSGFRPLFRYVPLSEIEFHDHVKYFYNIEDCIRKIREMKVYGNSHLSEESYRYARKNLKVDSRVKDLLTIVSSIL